MNRCIWCGEPVFSESSSVERCNHCGYCFHRVHNPRKNVNDGIPPNPGPTQSSCIWRMVNKTRPLDVIVLTTPLEGDLSVNNRNCQRCGGIMAPANDRWGWYLSCWSCGRTIELQLKRLQVASPEPSQEGDECGGEQHSTRVRLPGQPLRRHQRGPLRRRPLSPGLEDDHV